ncbi:hypothetical protein FRB97_002662 [Tulasnella sp. 331]|nr:hypothetical protein FRB97_002662 [Tulasnella sp. 331]KAG8883376.1 hypothetical protein FRB98_003148 [Tulasnella sp. 332]
MSSANMDFVSATVTASASNTHRPTRHRRGHSLPADFGSTLIPDPVPRLVRRKSIGSAIAHVKQEIFDARQMLSNLSIKVDETAKRTAAIETVLDQAQQQLDDHAVYFDARYPPPFANTVDITETKRQARASWEVIREQNAMVKNLTDSVQPLPYLTGRFPKAFPRRLAGVMALSDRQVDGLIFGYGIEYQAPRLQAGGPTSTLEHKRRTIARFIGVPDKALPPVKKPGARPRTWPVRPIDNN